MTFALGAFLALGDSKMPAPKYPTLDEIQSRTAEDQQRAYEKTPRTWPLHAGTVVNGDIDGVLHSTQEHMSSGDLSDAPADGGPKATGPSDGLPFKNMRSGR